MKLIKLALLSILVLVFLVLIILFGDLPSYKGTSIHQLRSFLVERIWQEKIRYQFIKLDRDYFAGYLSRVLFGREIKWIAGWVVPLLYIVIFTKCLELFFNHSYPSIHKHSIVGPFQLWCIIIPSISLNYYSFLMATFKDPGSMKKLNCSSSHNKKLNDSNKFRPNGIIYFDDSECRTCKLPKLARSKHCSTCDDCILMFDHHCIWLNNDVGYYTYKYFVIFLVSINWIFIYGAYLNSRVLETYISNEKLSTEIQDAGYFMKRWLAITNSTYDNEIAGILLLMCILLCPLILMFLGEHVWNMYLGVTTNETLKWDYIHELIDCKLLYKFVSLNNEETYLVLTTNDEPTAPRPYKFVTLKDAAVRFTNIANGKLLQITSWEDLDNIYDKGFLNNIKERLFNL